MKIRFNVLKSLFVGLLSFGLWTGCIAENEKMVPTGKISLQGKSYALIVKGTWGEGTLEFKGKKFKIKAKSLGAGYALGEKTFDIQGTVYNLSKLEDIEGNYYGSKAGITLVKGISVSNITNSKKVTLGLTTKSKGAAVDASLGLKKLSIKLVK